MKTFAVLAFLVLSGSAQAYQQGDSASTGWGEPLIGDARPSSTGSDVDVAALRSLVVDYQANVKKRDGKALLAMYVSDNAPVIGAFAEKSFAVVSAANKVAVPRTMPTTAKESVASEVKRPPDRITALVINTDGAVGTVSYDYAMPEGHGRIAWTVLRANDGWKIASVVYSINVVAADKS